MTIIHNLNFIICGVALLNSDCVINFNFFYNFSGEAAKSDDLLIPYVPYPINPSTNQPTALVFKPVGTRSELKYGQPIADPNSGLLVPIVAMTIHPNTSDILPLGGTHIDPVTRLPVPIEIGSLMNDEKSNQPVPILSVALNSATGM